MPKPHPGALAYPDTQYSAPVLADLSRPDERRRLSPAAMKTVFRIIDRWKISDEDARLLLGGVSNGSYYQLKRNPGSTKPLDQDRLVRISYLIGIFKSLNILYSQRLADQWMQLPNTNPIFAGLTPVAHLLRGGAPAMPAKYSPNNDSVLTRIADDEDLQVIFQLDDATNARLLAEEDRALSISSRELVFHVPHYRVINAAFTHANPLGARFSTPERGAWYAAFELATAKAEVLFHKSIEFAEIDWREREEIFFAPAWWAMCARAPATD